MRWISTRIGEHGIFWKNAKNHIISEQKKLSSQREGQITLINFQCG
jgi:hypothetical protein